MGTKQRLVKTVTYFTVHNYTLVQTIISYNTKSYSVHITWLVFTVKDVYTVSVSLNVQVMRIPYVKRGKMYKVLCR